MPASHAGDHRSKAGQGRQLIALKALSATHSLGKRIQLSAILSEGSISQSSQRSSGFHKPAVSGAAPGTATILNPMAGWTGADQRGFHKPGLREAHYLTPATIFCRLM